MIVSAHSLSIPKRGKWTQLRNSARERTQATAIKLDADFLGTPPDAQARRRAPEAI